MVVKAEPAAALEVTQPKLLLELFVVALHAPPKVGQANQLCESDAAVETGEPEFWLGVGAGSFDEKRITS